MSATQIVLYNAIDINKLTYGPVKTLDSGGRIVGIYHDNKPLVFQLPQCTAPFGLSKWSDNGVGGNDKYSLDLSLKGYDNITAMTELFDLMKSMENKFIDDTMTNSMAWLKKKINSREVAEAIFTPIVKFAKDKETHEITYKYPPTIKLSVPFKDGKCKVDIYDNKRNLLDLTELDLKGATVTTIAQVGGLWIAGGKAGITLKLIQMKVNVRNTIKGFSFIEDNDGNSDVEIEM